MLSVLLLGRYGRARRAGSIEEAADGRWDWFRGQMPASDRQANLRYTHKHMHIGSGKSRYSKVRYACAQLCFALLCLAMPVLVLPRSPPGQCKTTAGAKTPPDGRRSKGAYSVCESRLFPQRRFILPGSLSPRLRLRLRLRLPGVSPLTARARPT